MLCVSYVCRQFAIMDLSEEESSVEDFSVSSFDWSDEETKIISHNSETEEKAKGISTTVANAVWNSDLRMFVTQLLKSVYLSDIVIHCRGGKLPAHRSILCRSNLLRNLLESHIADIFLMDFDVKYVLKALELIYIGYLQIGSTELSEVKDLLNVLGTENVETVSVKDERKKKDKLKVKHEKNLSSRKVISDTKPPVVRKKRLLMANLDPRELTCDICQKSFSKLYKLKIHKLIHSSSFPFLCTYCSKGFNNKYKMHAHEKKHKDGSLESVKPKPLPKSVISKPLKYLQCTECTETFMMVKDLKKHSQIHKSKEQITCIHCSAICRSQKTLIAHLKVVHNDHESGLKCSCGVCGKRFQKMSSLEDHIMRHNYIKHFACMYCPKRCATKQDLDRHLRSHSGEANLVCQICSRTFVHRKTYTNHVRKHLGQKPYRCKPCNKEFGALNTLKKHQNSHQRKGDNTRIVTARKGSRDSPSVSFIENVSQTIKDVDDQSVEKIQPTSIYIPGPHYIQSGSSITPLSQMQVITDYTDVSRVNYDHPPSIPDVQNLNCSFDSKVIGSENRLSDCLYSGQLFKKSTHIVTSKIEKDCMEDTDSRDDGYLLGLFGCQPDATETTLEKL